MASLNQQLLDQDVTRLWRARKTLLEMLKDRGYAVLESSEDLHLSKAAFEEQFRAHNYNRDAITMLRQKRDDPTDQVYVFFPEEQRGKLIGIRPITERAERMERDGVSAAIFILQTGLTVYARNALDKLSVGSTSRIETFNENDLLVNITHHRLVPKHELMSEDEKKALLRRYKLKESQLPRIQRTDPIARYYGLRHGDVVKITRPSETAGRYVTYRLCVG